MNAQDIAEQYRSDAEVLEFLRVLSRAALLMWAECLVKEIGARGVAGDDYHHRLHALMERVRRDLLKTPC